MLQYITEQRLSNFSSVQEVQQEVQLTLTWEPDYNMIIISGRRFSSAVPWEDAAVRHSAGWDNTKGQDEVIQCTERHRDEQSTAHCCCYDVILMMGSDVTMMSCHAGLLQLYDVITLFYCIICCHIYRVIWLASVDVDDVKCEDDRLWCFDLPTHGVTVGLYMWITCQYFYLFYVYILIICLQMSNDDLCSWWLFAWLIYWF